VRGKTTDGMNGRTHRNGPAMNPHGLFTVNQPPAQ
jgi:hypothetical protein